MTEEESDTHSCTCLTDESELSIDGKWLKKFFKVPLKMAIKEIASKKPYDPVHYLGFWLLNYRRCEERRHWELERDNELNYLRSLVEEPVRVITKVSYFIAFHLILLSICGLPYFSTNVTIALTKLRYALSRHILLLISFSSHAVVSCYTRRKTFLLLGKRKVV